MSQTPKNRPPTRKVVSGQTGGGQGSARQQSYRNTAPPRRDPFPILIAGIFGLLVVGLLVLVYLFSSNSNNNNNNANNNNGVIAVGAATSTPVGVAPVVPGTVDPNASPTEAPPPRMPLAD